MSEAEGPAALEDEEATKAALQAAKARAKALVPGRGKNTLTDRPKQDRLLGLGRRQLGRTRDVTAYKPEMALAICERIAEGETLSEICRSDGGYPARQTFHRWTLQYPEVARAYTYAREISATAFEEEAISLGREIKDLPGSSFKVRAFEVLMNQLRWSASKRNPRVYSDRSAVNVTVPIQINTTLDLGAEGPQAMEGIYEIKAQIPSEVTGEELREHHMEAGVLADPDEVGARMHAESIESNRRLGSHKQRSLKDAKRVR